MAKIVSTACFDLLTSFTDVLYLSQNKQMRPRIRKLLRQRKLSSILLAISDFARISHRLDLIGTVIIENTKTGIIISVQGLILGLITPIIFFLYLMKKGRVADADATIKEERTIPYLFGIMISAIGLFLSIVIKLPPITAVAWGIYVLSMFLLLFINKHWKISAHALGSSIPLGCLLFFYGLAGFLYLPVIFLVGWSRIHLKKHNLSQVFAGSIAGISISLSTLYFFQ